MVTKLICQNQPTTALTAGTFIFNKVQQIQTWQKIRQPNELNRQGTITMEGVNPSQSTHQRFKHYFSTLD
jgi:hypothetical protein